MARLIILAAACVLIASVACVNQDNVTPSQFPTPSGPALSVEEYAKACYSSHEETLNKRGRASTQEQMSQFISDLRGMVPPRSLERFHYAYLKAWETTADEGLFFAVKEWTEADAQIGQMDDETYRAFEERGLCGFDEQFVQN